MPTQKKTTIGGQAIIEGIVMKGPKKVCTVVRKADGELVIKEEDAHQPSAIWKKPVPRRLRPVHGHEGRHPGNQLFGLVF